MLVEVLVWIVTSVVVAGLGCRVIFLVAQTVRVEVFVKVHLPLHCLAHSGASGLLRSTEPPCAKALRGSAARIAIEKCMLE